MMDSTDERRLDRIAGSSMERLQVLTRHLSPTGTSEPGSIKFNATSAAVYSSPSEFKYTVSENGVLTEADRQFYETNGFFVVRNCVPKEKLAQYRERFRAICDGEIKVPGLTYVKDIGLAKSEHQKKGERVMTKIQDFAHDEVLFDYCALPEVLKYVECITGPNIMAMHTMLINKPPDPGTQTSRHPMHQDLHYFPFRPQNNIVCAWTAMEKIDQQNGCLVVVPGTHHGELQPHGYPEWQGGVNKMYHGIQGYKPKEDEYIHLEMEEGDTVFFHPILIHGSGTNRTSRFRKAISCHYAASECDYIDVTGTTQESISNEVAEIAHKRLGKLADTLTFADIWRLRSRLVKGSTVNL